MNYRDGGGLEGGGRGGGEQHPVFGGRGCRAGGGRGGRGRGRGGRGGGEQHLVFGGRGALMGGRGGGRSPTGFVWPPPSASSPRPAAPGPYQPATAIYVNPAATGPHLGAYQHRDVRTPARTLVTVHAPFRPAHVSAPSSVSIAKELEQKLFVSETALDPPAVAAAAGQPAADKALFVSKKGLAHPTRPGVGTSGKKVVTSMICPKIMKYRGLVSAQPHRQEIIEDLFSVTKDSVKGTSVTGRMIRELLIAFRGKTGRWPERILFYRDGVSQGQFSYVLLHEMDALRKACGSLEEGYLPPVTFVVVQKRHHTRLFPEVHGKRTVVDLMICHPTEFDFYLCSHTGIQGTSRPTHYHVLYDENHFTADALQSLTNNYARCARAISVVTDYAHLATFHARYYVEGDSSDGGVFGICCQSDMEHFRPIQGLVSVPNKRTVCLPFNTNMTLEEIVLNIFRKLGMRFDCWVQVNGKLATLQSRISSLIKSEDADFNIYLHPRMRGGINQVPISTHIKSNASELYDIVLFPRELHFRNMIPYFIGLSNLSIDLALKLIKLVHKNYPNQCPARFTHEDIFYCGSTRKLSFRSDIELLDFTDSRYYHNMSDLGSVLSSMFVYDEDLLFSNHRIINVQGSAPWPKSWRIPLLLHLLVYDLQKGINEFDHLDITKNKVYFQTHIGVLSSAARFASLWACELDATYLGDPNGLEKIIGMRIWDTCRMPPAQPTAAISMADSSQWWRKQQPPPTISAADLSQWWRKQQPPPTHPSTAQSGSSSQERGQQQPPQPATLSQQQPPQPATLSQQQPPPTPPILSQHRGHQQQHGRPRQRQIVEFTKVPNWRSKAERNEIFEKLLGFRSYDTERVGEQFRCSVNWVKHGNEYFEQISPKQAECYLHLMFQGLYYNIRLRLQFPRALVNWEDGPCPFTPSDRATNVNPALVRNDFTREELLQIAHKKVV